MSGGGTEYDGGVWEKKETKKTITFILIKKPFFDNDYDELIIYKDITKNKKHCFRDWGDGSYTIYPNQCGIPYIFEEVVL